MRTRAWWWLDPETAQLETTVRDDQGDIDRVSDAGLLGSTSQCHDYFAVDHYFGG